MALRAEDSLLKVNTLVAQEVSLVGKTAAEIACYLDNDISQNPPVFDTIKVDKASLINDIIQKVDDILLDKVIDLLKAEGLVKDEDLQDKQIEILVKRGAVLGLGTIDQGEIEQMKKVVAIKAIQAEPLIEG